MVYPRFGIYMPTKHTLSLYIKIAPHLSAFHHHRVRVRFAITCWPVCISQSHWILAQSFSSVFGGVSQFDLGVFSPNVVQMYHPVRYASRLILTFHVFLLASYTLDFLWGFFAQPASWMLVW